MLRETESSNNLFYHSSHSSVDDDLISRGCARKAVESVCSCIPCVSGAFVPEMRGRSWADVGSSGRSCPLGQPCWCAPSSDFSHCQGSAPSNLIDKMAAFRVIGAKVDGRLAHPNHTPPLLYPQHFHLLGTKLRDPAVWERVPSRHLSVSQFLLSRRYCLSIAWGTGVRRRGRRFPSLLVTGIPRRLLARLSPCQPPGDSRFPQPGNHLTHWAEPWPVLSSSTIPSVAIIHGMPPPALDRGPCPPKSSYDLKTIFPSPSRAPSEAETAVRSSEELDKMPGSAPVIGSSDGFV